MQKRVLDKIKGIFSGELPKGQGTAVVPLTKKEVEIDFVASEILINDEIDGTRKPLLGSRGELNIELSDDVKYQIAAKISRLLPELVIAKKKELLEYSLYVVRALCQDQVTRVRRIIAEELKENPDAPRELIMMLAWDAQEEVAKPVIEFSPVLTDDDLIEIMTASKMQGVSESIAKRKAVSARVSSALANGGDVKAITELLKNRNAEIEENALMVIADGAREVEMWREPLLTRPELSLRVINRIATYVSRSMVESLMESGCISERVADELKVSVTMRLSKPEIEDSNRGEKKARKLHSHELLDAKEVEDALAAGDKKFAMAGISILARMPMEIVAKIIASKNPRAVTALAWKAGLSMRTAMQLQLKAAGIHHQEILIAKNGTEYPISPIIMCEYLELFGGS